VTSPAVLQAVAREVVAQATRADALRGPQGTRFHSPRSQAGTWARPRPRVRTVAVAAHGINTRVVGTALEQARPNGLSQHISGARGQAANAIKDPQRYLKAERTACPRFAAKQWRVLGPAAASVLRAT